jgi:hypothetical protein
MSAITATAAITLSPPVRIHPHSSPLIPGDACLISGDQLGRGSCRAGFCLSGDVRCRRLTAMTAIFMGVPGISFVLLKANDFSQIDPWGHAEISTGSPRLFHWVFSTGSTQRFAWITQRFFGSSDDGDHAATGPPEIPVLIFWGRVRAISAISALANCQLPIAIC